MSHLIKILLSVGVLTISQIGFAENPDWPQEVKAKLEKLIKRSKIPTEDLGVWVGFTKNGKDTILLDINTDKLFVPASLSKVITGGAALDIFPSGHEFKTKLSSVAKVEEGVLKGDLYFQGGGDPSFVSESMWFLVNELMREKIQKIEGDIIVDDSYFDNNRYPSDRDDVRVDRAYDAPIGALSFNWNAVNVFVRPGEKAGKPVQVFADPESDYIKVINRAVTAKGRVKNLRVSRLKDDGHAGDTILVSGELGIDRPEQTFYKNITKPEIWTGYHLLAFLKQRGISVTGSVKTGQIGDEGKILAEAKSSSMAKIVADMMKFSNNYVAEMLTKNLAAFETGKQGTMNEGLKSIRRFLDHKVKLPAKAYNFVNPSGLTRANKFRPSDIAAILTYLRDDFRIYPEFLSSLPISGVDGTLKDRMKKTPADTWIRAKTGMLSGVLGLAGYASRKNHQEIIFVFLFNGKPTQMNKAITLIDRMAVALVD